MKILDGAVHDGDHVRIDFADGGFTFTRALQGELVPLQLNVSKLA